MIHVYKAGGEHQKDGINYSIECINSEDIEFYTSNGWSDNLDDALSLVSKDEEGSEYEEKLRAEIKELGGKPAGRSSIKTLEKQLSELKDGTGNN